MSKYVRKGMIVATEEVHATLPNFVTKVASWAGKWTKADKWIIEQGFYSESIFDAAHGCRYLLFIIKYTKYDEITDARRACFDVLTAPEK